MNVKYLGNTEHLINNICNAILSSNVKCDRGKFSVYLK